MYPPATPTFQMIETNQTLREFPITKYLQRHCPGTQSADHEADEHPSGTNGSEESPLPQSPTATMPWFDVPLDSFNAFRLGVDVGLVGSLCLFGLVGNALTIATLRGDNHHRKRTTNWLLQVLAVLDIVYLVSAVFTHPYQTLQELTTLRSAAGSTAIGSTVVLLLLPYAELAAKLLRSISRTALVWVVVLVTVDRYMAVCRPLLAVEVRTLRHAQRAVAGVVVAAILYNIPRLFEYKIYTITDRCTNRSISKIYETPLIVDKVYFLVYRTVCYVVFRSVGPLVLLILLNTRLAVALRLVRHRRQLITTGVGRANNGRAGNRRENLTLMLVVVVSVFVVCELPDVCLRLTVTAFEFVDVLSVDGPTARYANVVCNALHAVNSSTNFLVYCLLGRRFRRILRRRLADMCSQPSAFDAGSSGPDGRMVMAANVNNNNAGVLEENDYRVLRTAPPTRQLDGGTTALTPSGNQMFEDINLEIVPGAGSGKQQRSGDDERQEAVVLHQPLAASLSV